MTDHTMRPDVALVTYDARREVTADDSLFADALSERGAAVHAVPWSDRSVRWASFDAVVVRSCWDYFLRADEFHRWLDDLEAHDARVFNDTATLRWNADKAYLRELEARAVPVIPTRWLERGGTPSLSELRRATGWSALVVKPTVSGGAHRTWRALPGGEGHDDLRLATMVGEGAAMVQPLIDAIERDGEWSLVFLDGRFSHAVLKRPRDGDFRVQHEHGGSLAAADPPAAVIAAAERVLANLPTEISSPLYARIDGCIVDDSLLLMELELLEPELFFRFAPAAADRMADALLARLGQTSAHEY